ncbi:MAG: EutN/CcmL family microcompartment protein [Candidatus Limiplasma sp.]|nr:EutN/CcmL family microcompartment protein [Candidatus Limiplasma sp.]
MLVGRVTGSVVSTHKVPSLGGAKLLIVQPVELDTLTMKDDYVICVDDVGAGEGDLVFCAYGSSARQSDTSQKMASDYSIYGILDSIDILGARTYDKGKEANPCSWQK